MSFQNLIRKTALTLAMLATVAFMPMLTSTVFAQELKQFSDSQTVTAKATVEAVNKTDRTVLLKGARGNLVLVYADETVKRFDELKVGDVVTATYTVSVAARIRKPGEPEPVREKATAMALKGKKPAGEATAEQTVTVSIEEIDRSIPMVTVKAPDSRVYSFRVSDVKNLAGLTVGDKVDITFRAALLLKADLPTQ